jgi:hypothetical protein
MDIIDHGVCLMVHLLVELSDTAGKGKQQGQEV